MQEATTDIEAAHTVQTHDDSVCRRTFVLLALLLIVLLCIRIFTSYQVYPPNNINP